MSFLGEGRKSDLIELGIELGITIPPEAVIKNGQIFNNITADGHVQKTEILTTTGDIGIKEKYEKSFQQGRWEEPTPLIDHRINSRDHLPFAVPPYRMFPIKKETSKQEINQTFSASPIRPLRKHGRLPTKTGRLYLHRFLMVQLRDVPSVNRGIGKNNLQKLGICFTDDQEH
ncbi:hypothetical protein CEXT_236061 [Caerostris extrusa]|uniref:Uncharacterized protein n=1 Tax=Caerostris extrusa TaxID=172846 RepID=A0AAV4SK02_CAEEX|nr:hypothetical protein CEXT_236061 [Caerostris extrusa]